MKRLAQWVGFSLVAALCGLAAAGCDGVCTDSACSCDSGDDCEFECPDGSCSQACEGDSSCEASCEGGGCSQSCTGAASCTFSCEGGGCTQSCLTTTGTCTATCTGGGCTSDT